MYKDFNQWSKSTFQEIIGKVEWSTNGPLLWYITEEEK